VGRRAARELGKGLPAQDARILDVAAGSAVWSIPFAEDLSQARVTALDFAQVLDTTRAYAKRHGVGDRFDYIEGNLRDVDLGEGRFDLAVLGNIIHSEGEASTRDLFGRLHRSLRASGRVAILDMIPEDDRSGPVFPLGFALNMLLHTAEGDTYTFAQISQWLKDAGFTAVDRVDIQFHSPMIVATR